MALLALAVFASMAAQEAAPKDLFFQGLQGRDIKIKSVAKPDYTQRAMFLGVRYNLVRVLNVETREFEEVDPDYNFKTGDCFFMRFMPNRNGSLFLLNKGSSGSWTMLMPGLPDESPVVAAGVETEFPAQHCLKIEDPPGVEDLTFIITDRDSDADSLRVAMRAGNPAELAKVVSRLTETASAEVQNIASRDLKVVRLSYPVTEAGQPPKSVYAVSTLASATDSLTLKIRILHK